MSESHRNKANVPPDCGEMSGRVLVFFFMAASERCWESDRGGADVARRVCACLSASLAETA